VRATGLAPGVPCVTKNRSDVCVCQCPETPRNSADIKQVPKMSSDLYVYAVPEEQAGAAGLTSVQHPALAAIKGHPGGQPPTVGDRSGP
jgi:hypothetical protein